MMKNLRGTFSSPFLFTKPQKMNKAKRKSVKTYKMRLRLKRALKLDTPMERTRRPIEYKFNEQGC
jgi:hypothetical protein